MSRIIFSILLLATFLPLSALQPGRGYRGFIDCSATFNIDINLGGPADSYMWLGGSTSHGYQFNKWLYVGGGIGYEAVLTPNDRRPKRIFPVFADARADLAFGRFTPFADIKIGANFTRGAGMYFSPTVGYSFNWGRRTAINLAIGATFFGHRFHRYEHIMAPDGGITDFKVVGSYHGIDIKPTLRLGFEF